MKALNFFQPTYQNPVTRKIEEAEKGVCAYALDATGQIIWTAGWAEDYSGHYTNGDKSNAAFFLRFSYEQPIPWDQPGALSMNEIITKAKAAGFQDFYSGMENTSKGRQLVVILINHDTADVVEVWENGTFDIYNQFGEQPTFTI